MYKVFDEVMVILVGDVFLIFVFDVIIDECVYLDLGVWLWFGRDFFWVVGIGGMVGG